METFDEVLVEHSKRFMDLSITHKMRPPPDPSNLTIRESYESLVAVC
jgi:hypothetical protein